MVFFGYAGQPGRFLHKPARQEVSGHLTWSGKYFMYSHMKCAISVCNFCVLETCSKNRDVLYTQTEVSDIMQISRGMLTNASKKRKIKEGNLQKVKVTILRHQRKVQRLTGCYHCSLYMLVAAQVSLHLLMMTDGDQARERPPGGFFSLGGGQTRRGRTVRCPDTSVISTYPSEH